MRNSDVFRSKNWIMMCTVGYGMLILFAVEEWVTATTSGFFRAASVLVVVGIFIYLIFQRPAIILSDECIRIINPLSEIAIGWQDIESIEARYTMSIETTDGDCIYAWAANAPGRYHSRKIHPSDIRGMNLPDLFRAGESPRTDSGVATHLARLKLKQFHESATFTRSRVRFTAGYIAIIVSATTALMLNIL